MTTMTGQRRGLVLPRFGTPRNPDLPTRGHELAEVAERLGVPPLPWIRHAFDVLYEYDPDNEGRQLYDTDDTTIMRQCGKTMGFFTPRMVHRTTMVPNRLGRQRVMFTMHKRDKARQKLERDIAPMLRDSESFREITNPKARPGRSNREWKISLNNGGEHLLFGRGNYLQIDTPSKKAGHSDTLDAAFFDEIRFAQTDDVEAGVRPTMITRFDKVFARASTAGDHESFYMWPLVVTGRKHCADGQLGKRAYFEWSIPEDADLHDPEVWWEFHPALGWTIQLDDIMAELRAAENHPDESKLDTFRQEYANQWVRHPQLADGPREFVLTAEQLTAAEIDPRTPFLAPRTLGVDMAPDGQSGSIVLAGWNAGGYGQVKVLRQEAGWFWIEQAVRDAIVEHEPAAISYDSGGPTAALAPAIARAAGTLPIEPLAGKTYGAACAGFVTGFTQGRYKHMQQEWFLSAVAGVTLKQTGSYRVWDRQVALADITPVPAATCALWALESRPPPRRSAYDDDDFVSV